MKRLFIPILTLIFALACTPDNGGEINGGNNNNNSNNANGGSTDSGLVSTIIIAAVVLVVVIIICVMIIVILFATGKLGGKKKEKEKPLTEAELEEALREYFTTHEDIHVRELARIGHFAVSTAYGKLMAYVEQGKLALVPKSSHY